MTLLEVVLALGILVMGLLTLSAAMHGARGVNKAAKEQVSAFNAARNQLEKLRNERFVDVYARYNVDPADDPGGPGAAPGAEFDVPGLMPMPGKRVGRIVFPEKGSPPALREDVEDPVFGMPKGRDLNRDGVIDGAPRAGDYRILPVRVLLEWKDARGTRRLELNAFLSEKAE